MLKITTPALGVRCGLIGLIVAMTWAMPCGAPGQDAPPAAGATEMTPEQIEAMRQQQEAAIEARFREFQAWSLVDIARAMNPPTAPSDRELPSLWQLDRRIAMLTAAQRIEENFFQAALLLYQARAEASQAWSARADALDLAVARARADGHADQADRLSREVARARTQADRHHVAGVEALGRYVRNVPDDVPMWQALLGERLSLLQSAEQRIALLEKELGDLRSARSQADANPAELTPPPPEKASIVLTRLADYRARRTGIAATQPDDQARAPLALLDEAIKEMPTNVEARLLRAQLAGNEPTPAERLELLLAQFRLNPIDMGLADEIAALLTRHGVYSDEVNAVLADEPVAQNRGSVGWLDYHEKMFKDAAPRMQVPSDLLIEQARTLALAGRPVEAAAKAATAIAQSESGTTAAASSEPIDSLPVINLSARIVQCEALAAAADKAVGDERDKLAARRDAAVAEVVNYQNTHKEKPAFRENAALQAMLAWFHLRVTGDAKKAASLARSARSSDKGDSALVALALGAALAEAGDDPAEAIKLLTPLGRADNPWANYYLAVAAERAKATDNAKKLLTSLARDWSGHPAGIAAAARLANMNLAAPAVNRAALLRLLRDLPAGLFDFYRRPGGYASVDLAVVQGGKPGEPIVVLVRVANRSAELDPAGPFPITVGPGMMIEPNLLLSAAVALPNEEKPRVLRDFCEIRLAMPLVVPPNVQHDMFQTVDVGPLGQLIALTPQATREITLEATVNPAPGQGGGWVYGLGGYAKAISWKRAPLAADAESVMSLYYHAERGDKMTRLQQNDLIGSLLAEQQLARANRLAYSVRDVPIYRLANKLAAAASDQAPEVRAFLCDALYPAGLTRDLRKNALALTQDPNWLVRFMAVRLVAERIGPTARKSVADRARNDSEDAVRRLAQTYLDQWDQAAGK